MQAVILCDAIGDIQTNPGYHIIKCYVPVCVHPCVCVCVTCNIKSNGTEQFPLSEKVIDQKQTMPDLCVCVCVCQDEFFFICNRYCYVNAHMLHILQMYLNKNVNNLIYFPNAFKYEC